MYSVNVNVFSECECIQWIERDVAGRNCYLDPLYTGGRQSDLCFMNISPLKPPPLTEILRCLSASRRVNIVDHMLRLMERYANNLEELVEQRTVQLQEEKQKTDMLLYRMLPPYGDTLRIHLYTLRIHFMYTLYVYTIYFGRSTLPSSTLIYYIDNYLYSHADKWNRS